MTTDGGEALADGSLAFGTSDRGAGATGIDPGIIDLDSFLPYRLSVLANSVSRLLAELYEQEFQITTAEWRLMAILARVGPISANGVCERTAMDKVRVSRAVARATSQGLVHREIDPRARRRSVLTLTPRGRAMHDRIVPRARAREAELLAELSPDDREALLDLLRKVQSKANVMGPAVVIDGDGD